MQRTSKPSVPGVPFYVKVAQCKQETTWLQPYYALTLKKTITTKFADEAWAKDQDEGCKACNKACAGSPPADVQACNKCTTVYKGCEPAPTLPLPQVAIGTQVLSLSDYQKPEVHTLQVEISSYNSAAISAPSDADKIDGLWKTILRWQFYLPLAVKEDELVKSTDAIEVANKSAPEKVVDYSRTYYYNTPRPWVGMSQLDVHLDADQTLSEASSQVQSQTLSTILSALPISSVLTTVAGAALGKGITKGTGDPYKTKPVAEYEFTTQQNGYTHTHSKYVPFKIPCDIEADGVRKDYALSIDTAASTGAPTDKPTPAPAPSPAPAPATAKPK